VHGVDKVRHKNPLIVQSDFAILAEVDSPGYGAARDRILAFAELQKAPEHVHTYRITPLSIWNARACGMTARQILDALHRHAKYPVPPNVCVEIQEQADRYGLLTLSRVRGTLVLSATDAATAEEVCRHREVQPLLGQRLDATSFAVPDVERGRLKQALIKVGFPAEDRAGYAPADPLPIALRAVTREGRSFTLRPYQVQAADAFHARGGALGGSGVVALPCGAGKTVVGIACMARLQQRTLVLTTGTTAVRQWIGELLDKTTLTEEDLGEYTGERKDIRPVTVSTYQMLTHRTSREAAFDHIELFDAANWGLIVYDEVHMLPAPVFQVTAGLQARRRLGLTATLVREDGREDDVFALIGPKKLDIPWKTMERQGWIARARCTEIRLPLTADERKRYAVSDANQKFRIASENPGKIAAVRSLLDRHRGEQILVIGMYVEQIRRMAEGLEVPVLTGATSQKRRDELYRAFRRGEIRVLAVSKIANFAVDLPDASVAIQVSGTFGSRQEEAQRLGRILRPKAPSNQAHFYTVVTRETVEQDFALRRQLFLCEQGYEYAIVRGELPEAAGAGA
jgi:DNA excision repair protein ERCC-3